MKSIVFVFSICFLSSSQALAWGANGHRAVGEIADQFLSAKAKRELKKVIGGQNLADQANWPDHIKSYSKYRPYSTWHYNTVEDGTDYSNPKDPGFGTALQRIEDAKKALKGADPQDIFTYKQSLAWLVHLIGDIHQPLHVGRSRIVRGGNRVHVMWFRKRTNLHAVWDTQIIDQARMSYTELAASAMRLAKNKKWKTGGSAMDWLNESVGLRNYAYDLITDRLPDLDTKPAPLKPVTAFKNIILTDTYYPADEDLPRLGYSYQARNFEIVQMRIFQAGVRLAETLNGIYSGVSLKRN